jgi:hypothetical protein
MPFDLAERGDIQHDLFAGRHDLAGDSKQRDSKLERIRE